MSEVVKISAFEAMSPARVSYVYTLDENYKSGLLLRKNIMIRGEIINGADADTLTEYGTYCIGANGANFPVTNTNGGVLQVIGHSPTYFTQFYHNSIEGAVVHLYMRHCNAGKFGKWSKTTFVNDNVPAATSFTALSMLGLDSAGDLKKIGIADMLIKKDQRTDFDTTETGIYSVRLSEAEAPFAKDQWVTLVVIQMGLSPSPIALQIASNSSKLLDLYVRSYSENATAKTGWFKLQKTTV